MGCLRAAAERGIGSSDLGPPMQVQVLTSCAAAIHPTASLLSDPTSAK